MDHLRADRTGSVRGRGKSKQRESKKKIEGEPDRESERRVVEKMLE